MPNVVVLVTGGTGLVGRAVQEIFAEQAGHEGDSWVFAGSNDGDLTSRQAAAALFASVQPTYVLHLAAKVGGLYANSSDKVGFWLQNMAIQVCCQAMFTNRVTVERIGIDVHRPVGPGQHIHFVPRNKSVQTCFLPEYLHLPGQGHISCRGGVSAPGSSASFKRRLCIRQKDGRRPE